jgi:hypothetical protein
MPASRDILDILKIYSLYRDFFAFLDNPTFHRPKWRAYYSTYYKPHRDFFEAYFSIFPLLDLESLRDRVESVKKGDYSGLRNLLALSPPEAIIERALRRCRQVTARDEEPDVYLFVGFFSPDAFIMNLKEKAVICFGLERYKDFNLMAILFAHEYAHFLMCQSPVKIAPELEWKWRLMAEGLATVFSSRAIPERPLADHFLVRRDALNWYAEKEDLLRKIYNPEESTSKEILEIFAQGKPELSIPPRAGKYLAFQAVKKYLGHEQERIEVLLADKKALLSLEI